MLSGFKAFFPYETYFLECIKRKLEHDEEFERENNLTLKFLLIYHHIAFVSLIVSGFHRARYGACSTHSCTSSAGPEERFLSFSPEGMQLLVQ
jgi:hypothetical protein